MAGCNAQQELCIVFVRRGSLRQRRGFAALGDRCARARKTRSFAGNGKTARVPGQALTILQDPSSTARRLSPKKSAACAQDGRRVGWDKRVRWKKAPRERHAFRREKRASRRKPKLLFQACFAP